MTVHNAPRMLLGLLWLLCILLQFNVSHAQDVASDSLKTNEEENPDKATYRVMPYLSYNRNLEFMMGVIPMVMYKLDKEDKVSPKSLSGLAAVYTTNSSYFISFFNRFFLKEDQWRITLYGVTGDNNSQFFMDNLEAPGFYDYTTKTTIISAGAQRKVSKEIYLGFNYTYSNFYTEYEDDVLEADETITNGLEITSLYDTRNALYYPTQGIQARLKWLTLPQWFANEETANKIKAEYNQYFEMRAQKDVLAARVSGIFGLGEIAFQQQETIGGKDIRGYSQGKYRGDGIIALQAEYRFNFHPRMGLVGFGGFATLYGSDSADFNWKLYPGGGVGYRFKAFQEENFNIGLDAAVGKDDWGLYFRIGEAF